MYHTVLVHPADGRLGCFPVLAIINSAALNTAVHVLFSDLFPLGVCPAVGFLGHVVVLFLLF